MERVFQGVEAAGELVVGAAQRLFGVDAQMARDILKEASIPVVHIPSLSTGIFGVPQATRVAVPEEWIQQAERLLKSVNWSGVAMVEFKVDEATGRPYLMEINGRFWGPLQLAIDALLRDDNPGYALVLYCSDESAVGPFLSARAGEEQELQQQKRTNEDQVVEQRESCATGQISRGRTRPAAGPRPVLSAQSILAACNGHAAVS